VSSGVLFPAGVVLDDGCFVEVGAGASPPTGVVPGAGDLVVVADGVSPPAVMVDSMIVEPGKRKISRTSDINKSRTEGVVFRNILIGCCWRELFLK